MELIIIRHAPPVRCENADPAADPALGGVGLAQAEHMAGHLTGERIHAVFTRPSCRARPTTPPLARRVEVEPRVAHDATTRDRHEPDVPIRPPAVVAPDRTWIHRSTASLAGVPTLVAPDETPRPRSTDRSVGPISTS